MRHPAEDDLALLALGEDLPAVADHVAACAGCSAELLALGSTVRTARAADLGALPPPPPEVWQRVSDELGLAPTGPAPGAEPGPRPGRALLRRRRSASVPHTAGQRPARRPRSRTAWLGAAALAVTAVAVGALVVGGQTRAPDRSRLAALGSSGGTGEAVLRAEGAGRVLEVDTQGLAPPDGFYEVWLLEPGTSRILALGTLDEHGRAVLSVPDGVDLSEYAVVDVSDEPDDGDPGHSSDSVLRGDLPA